jgi:RNase H-fold protein (predicted Holliday junction resolvase)
VYLGFSGTRLDDGPSHIVHDVGLKSCGRAVGSSIFWFCIEGDVVSSKMNALRDPLDKLNKLILYILNKRNKRNYKKEQ